MFDYSSLKKEAISLRQKGETYSEILNKIRVSKSTLSLWLRDVGLSKRVQHKMSEKKLLSAKRGGLARKNQADQIRSEIYSKSMEEIGKISKRELLILGATLYWAEGTKEKQGHAGTGVQFINSDPVMVRVFLKWLKVACDVKDENIKLSFYIHETCKERVEESLDYWASKLSISKMKFASVYFKKGNIKTRRQNIGNKYYGIVSVTVLKSSSLLRRITGWSLGIGNSICGIV